MRKDMRLNVADFIEVWFEASDELLKAINMFREYIAEETRASRIEIGNGPEDAYFKEWSIDGGRLRIWIRRTERRS